MSVVYWQAFIAASITAAFWLGRWFRGVGRVRPRWWMPVIVLFWLVWTLSNVFSPQLMVVQLTVVVGAFMVNAHFARQLSLKHTESLRAKAASERAQVETQRASRLQVQVDSLKAELELTAKELELLSLAPEESLRFLTTEEEHRAALREQVDAASSRLLITSGWISDRVVNQDFLVRLGQALDRGVSVLILFGYTSKNDPKPLVPRARNALKRLIDMSRGNSPSRGGRLVIAYAPVHAKVLVRDSEVALVGSSNWLSNDNYINAESTVEVRFSRFVDEIAGNTAKIAHGAEAGVIERLLRGGVA